MTIPALSDDGHCKLKIEKCKLQIAPRPARVVSSRERLLHCIFHFSFFIFQFAISVFLSMRPLRRYQ
jgi:hypothetical protein